MIEFIHISDTHFGYRRDHDFPGSKDVCARAEMLVDAINGLPFSPDFVIHTGDVAYDPDKKAYALAEEVLSQIEAPVYYATGNHDSDAMIREAMTFGEMTPLVPESEDQLCYRLDGAAADFGEFFVIDAKVPPEVGAHGTISENQMAAVLDAISGEKPVAIFLHFPLTRVGSEWIDDHLLVTNGVDCHARFLEASGDQLRGIFFGHLHRGIQVVHSGVLQSGVASPACEFTTGPYDTSLSYLPGGPVPFNHVSMSATETIIKSYALPFPSG